MARGGAVRGVGAGDRGAGPAGHRGRDGRTGLAPGLAGAGAPLGADGPGLRRGSRQRPDAGGFSDAIERAFGPRWGMVSGWLFLAQNPTGSVVAALIAGHSLASATGGGEAEALAYGGALLAAAYALNALGLRVSALAQLATLAVLATGLVVVAATALPAVEPAAFTPFFSRGGGAVGLAAVQLFWAFVGWEAITPLAREFRDPRDIWRASLVAVVTVGAVYLTLAVAVVGTPIPRAASGAPLVFLAGRVFGQGASFAVGIAGYLLCFIPLNAYAAGTSRLVHALAARGQLPSILAPLSPSGTPRRALAALACGSSCALVAAWALGLGAADYLPISTSAFLATYVLSMAAAVKLLRGPLRLAAVISLAACVAVLWFVGPLVLWLGAVAAAALAYRGLTGAGPERRAALLPQDGAPGR
ncbi:MAG: amino acid permease [Anaeromyxobacter sp.]